MRVRKSNWYGKALYSSPCNKRYLTGKTALRSPYKMLSNIQKKHAGSISFYICRESLTASQQQSINQNALTNKIKNPVNRGLLQASSEPIQPSPSASMWTLDRLPVCLHTYNPPWARSAHCTHSLCPKSTTALGGCIAEAINELQAQECQRKRSRNFPKLQRSLTLMSNNNKYIRRLCSLW